MENNERGMGRPSDTSPQYKRGKNYFLGIAIDDYAQPYNPLRNCVLKTFVGHEKPIKTLAFSADGEDLVTGGEDNTSLFWRITTDAVEDRMTSYTFFEMMQLGLQIEPYDTPQYMDELVTYVEQTNMDKALAAEKANEYLKDEALLKEVRRRLGIT